MKKFFILCASVMMLSACNNDVEQDIIAEAPKTQDAYAALSAELNACSQSFLAGSETLPQTRGKGDPWAIVEADAEGAVYGFTTGKGNILARLARSLRWAISFSAFEIITAENYIVSEIAADVEALNLNPQPHSIVLTQGEDLGAAHNEALSYLLVQIVSQCKTSDQIANNFGALVNATMAAYGISEDSSNPDEKTPGQGNYSKEMQAKIDWVKEYTSSYRLTLHALTAEKTRENYTKQYEQTIRQSNIESEDKEILVNYVDTYGSSNEFWMPLTANKAKSAEWLEDRAYIQAFRGDNAAADVGDSPFFLNVPQSESAPR